MVTLKTQQNLREYSIDDTIGDCTTGMTYCYHCSTKLPKSLRNEWCDTLREQHKIKEPLDDYKEQAPKEFHTDKWWKKRDL